MFAVGAVVDELEVDVVHLDIHHVVALIFGFGALRVRTRNVVDVRDGRVVHDVFVDDAFVVDVCGVVVSILYHHAGGEWFFEGAVFAVILDVERVFLVAFDVKHVITKVTELHYLYLYYTSIFVRYV